jgi:hypothetical protein
VAQNDFLQGDFYGDALQGSFVRKLLEDLTPNRPFGYETSFSVELRDHTGSKSEPLLEAKAAAAIADGAAFIFIDAVDPIGTVSPRVHERMGRVFDRLLTYYQHLGGERVRDIAVYYSLESKFDFRSNGQSERSADRSDAHTRSSMNASRWLLAEHLPFGVVTKRSLEKLDGVKVLVLSGVNMMDEEEVAAIRRWVRRGGALYASGGTSLVTKRGQLQPDFLLADVFGVSLRKADWADREHYVAPAPAGQRFLGEFTAKYPAFVKGYGMEVKAHDDVTVLATTTRPWPAPEPTQFSSIHSNPPWVPTDEPEIVEHRYGEGRAIYASTLIENVDGLGSAFSALVRHLGGSFSFEVDAPPPVEVTMFRQPGRRRLVMSFVNFQKDLPNIPIFDIPVKVRLPEGEVARIRLLRDGRLLEHAEAAGVISFTLPRLDTLAMVAVELR